MSSHDADIPTGAGSTDPLLAALRAARPEPPDEVLSPHTEPNRALVEEIIMTATDQQTGVPAPVPGPDPGPVRRDAGSRRRLALLTGAVAASAVAVAALVVAPWSVEESSADALIRDAATATRAALADTGRATLSAGIEVDGEPSGALVTSVEFAGDDERFLPQSGCCDTLIVDGETYARGYDDRHPDRWYQLECGAGNLRSTPDPRDLAGVLTPTADFEVVGEEVIDGVPTTHLRAGDPAAIPGEAILAESRGLVVTALDIWVDGEDVVRRIDVDLETEEATDDRTGAEQLPGYSIKFSDLGEDIVIVAPPDFEVVTAAEACAPAANDGDG